MVVYKGDLEWIDRIDIDAPHAGVTIRWPEEYVDAYSSAVGKAKGEGLVEEEVVYDFLKRLLAIFPSYDTPGTPYVEAACFGNRRTEIPSDLSDKDKAAIRRLIARTSDTPLLARLYDLLYVSSGKDFHSAAQAAPLMLAAAERLAGTSQAHYMKEGLLRSIQLAKRIGWSKEIGETVRNTVIRITQEAPHKGDDFELLSCLRLVREQQLGDPAEWRKITDDAATRLIANSKPFDAQNFWELSVGFCQALRDVEGEHGALRNIGESFVAQSAIRASGRGASYMAAAGLLQSGIVKLQQGKATDERIEELKTLLVHYQSRVGDEMFSVGDEIDITESSNSSREHVSGRTFGIALLHLAFGAALVNINALRKRVLDLAKDNPMLFLINTEVKDDKGRTKQIQRGISDLEGDDFEQELRLKMFAQACLMDWSLRVQAQIEPARMVVFTEHHPTKDDLLPLVSSNPFIPPGHEGLILRGLLAGFQSDYVSAAHLLVPQFEACIRHFLESSGIHVTTFEHDGTEKYKLWGGMLDIPVTRKAFGEQYIFEIEGILLSEAGFNFRNELAHGMLTEAQCISVPAVSAWWLMLRLCLQPVAARFAGNPDDSIET
jgi:hypothetical protein